MDAASPDEDGALGKEWGGKSLFSVCPLEGSEILSLFLGVREKLAGARPGIPPGSKKCPWKGGVWEQREHKHPAEAWSVGMNSAPWLEELGILQGASWREKGKVIPWLEMGFGILAGQDAAKGLLWSLPIPGNGPGAAPILCPCLWKTGRKPWITAATLIVSSEGRVSLFFHHFSGKAQPLEGHRVPGGV